MPTPCQQGVWDTVSLAEPSSGFSSVSPDFQPDDLQAQGRLVYNDKEEAGAQRKPPFPITQGSHLYSQKSEYTQSQTAVRLYLNGLTRVHQRLEFRDAELFGTFSDGPPFIHVTSLPRAMRWPMIGVY